MNKRLKILRNNLGLSQKEFGKRHHLSISQISSYETKARNIPERTISNIIKEFNVNPNWINCGIEPMLNDDSTSPLNLVDRIKSLSNEDQQFIIKIVDTLYKSSFHNRLP